MLNVHSDKKEITGNMTDELKKLEAKRNTLYKKIMSLGDFRRGTISGT
jgi:hypothetical protein